MKLDKFDAGVVAHQVICIEICFSMSYCNEVVCQTKPQLSVFNALPQQVFHQGLDPHTPRTHYLKRPINSRYVKIQAKDWQGEACMRVQLIGSQESLGGVSQIIYLV